MINIKEELIASLRRLAIELEKSGKSDTSKFFGDIAEQLKDDIDVVDVLDKLVSSGSIAQYANFSSSEDLIYEEIHKMAVELKRSYFGGS